MGKTAHTTRDAGRRRLRELDALIVDCQATSSSPRHGHLLEVAWCRARGVPEGGPPTDIDEAVACLTGVDASEGLGIVDRGGEHGLEHRGTHQPASPGQRDDDGDPSPIASTYVSLPDGAEIPRRIRAMTGIQPADLEDAPRADDVWRTLLEAASAPGGAHESDTVPHVFGIAHYARIERSFLRHVHQGLMADDAPFPVELLCTHAIAARLFPDLPRRGIRAVSGFLGQPLPELKRAACHVGATAFIWAHLVHRLEADHGVETLDDLMSWLDGEPVRRPTAGYAFPLPRERRLSVPRAPGVYEMLGRDGEVLYVGKATRLRRRVNSYFQKRRHSTSKTLELLVQVYDLDITTTATPLEAALLETDAIKAASPPYNVALRARTRELVYAARDDFSISPAPTERHLVGPLPDGMSPRIVAALVTRLSRSGTSAPTLPEASWLPGRDDPGAEALWSGALELFRARHDIPAAPTAVVVSRLCALGRTLHRARVLARTLREKQKAEAAVGAGDGEAEPAARDEGSTDAPDSEADETESEAPEWTPSRLVTALEDALRRTARNALRARWMRVLMNAAVVWTPSESDRRRMLVTRNGEVMAAHWIEAEAEIPRPPACRRLGPDVFADFDVSTWDRLRVLTTGLRRLAGAGSDPSVWFGRGAPLSGSRLGAFLCGL